MNRNVLHIIAVPAAGGTEAFVRDLCIALKRSGWAPHIAFIDRARDLGKDAGFEEAFLKCLDEAGVGYTFLGHECRRKPWLGALRLRSLASKLGIGMIHSHLAYGNFFAAGVPKIPVAYTHHSENARFSKWVYRYFRWRLSRWIGISRKCAEELEKFSGQPAVLIRNAIDLSRFQANSAVRHANESPVRAISVGRINPHKDYETMAHAIVRLGGPGRFAVDIFGEGDDAVKVRCAEILAQGNAEGAMRFLGTTSDIPAEMAKRSLFLMSSITEGMPIALIEATASGLPAVVTDVGGCREIVEECESGVVVPASDPKALADAVGSLLNDPERLSALSANAFRNSPAFSVEIAAEAHERLYREVLA